MPGPVFILLFFLFLLDVQAGEIAIAVSGDEQIMEDQLKYTATKIRKLSLAPGSDYTISCAVHSFTDDLLNSPWLRSINGSSIAVERREKDNIIGPASQVFYYTSSTSYTAYLKLHQFDESLVGTYTCATEEDSRSVAISLGNPSVTFNSVRFDRIEGSSSSIDLKLLVFGYLKPSPQNITWFFNNELLDFDQMKISMNVVVFNMPYTVFIFRCGFNRKHTGTYTALINTTAGTAKESFFLQVYTLPQTNFSSDCNCLKDHEITMLSGSNFTLSCNAQISDPIPQLTWFKDGIDDSGDLLVPNDNLSIEYASPFESRLVFKDVTVAYAGTYYCKANNTLMKNIQSVDVRVKNFPKVTAISPLNIDAPIGNKLQLLVKIEGEFDPAIAVAIVWTHQVNETSHTSIIVEDNRVVLTGALKANLTIWNITTTDNGHYDLEVTYGSMVKRIAFNISILVPPMLSKLTNDSIYALIDGSATFIVYVGGAIPPLKLLNLVWSGNFREEQRKVTYEGGVVTLVLNRLAVFNSGYVILSVYHPTGTVHVTFQLFVLNAPAIPNPVSVVQCARFVEIGWKSPAILTPDTAPGDIVRVEQRQCAVSNAHCNEEWEDVGMVPSSVEYLRVSLAPAQYSFRLTSCSNLVGCGMSLVLGTEIKLGIQELMPEITEVSSHPVNFSSLEIAWKQVLGTDCNEISSYEITCHQTRPIIITDTITISNTIIATESGYYSVIISPLEPDTQYNCSIVPLYIHPLSPSLIAGREEITSIIGHTYPVAPSIASFDVSVTNQSERWIAQGNIFIDNFDSVKTLQSEVEISHLHVMVLRLGHASSLPNTSVDIFYKSLNDFSNHQEVHDNNNSRYLPYIAAEFDMNRLPDRFTIGANDGSTYTNGPLNTLDYYTVFIRLYARSQFGKQYGSFASSGLSRPLLPFRSAIVVDDSALTGLDANGSSLETVVSVTVCVVLAMIVFTCVIAIILVKIKCAKRLQKDNSSIASAYFV